MAQLSFSEDIQSSLSFSGGQQSWSRASEGELSTEDPATSLEEQDEQYELSDSNNDEMKLSKKWIDYLKGKGRNSGRYQPDHKLQAEIPWVSSEELQAQQSFCTIKINLMNHRMSLKKNSRCKNPQLGLNTQAPETDALNCIVPDELLNRIYFKNMRVTLKQVAAAKQHILSQCPSCNRKRAELAQSAFLRQKKSFLESLLLEEKIDEHLHTTDFLTRVGEAHKSFPRLLDDPRIIWKRLNEKAQIHNCRYKAGVATYLS